MDNPGPLRDGAGKLVTQYKTQGPAPLPPTAAPDLLPREAATEESSLAGTDFTLQSKTARHGEAPAPAGAAKRRRPGSAVFVAHGMGQQIPFATLDQVVEGIRQQDLQRRKSRGAPVRSLDDLPKPWTNTIEHETDRIQRVELCVLDEGNGERSVHVYEGYWAPLVEGNVTLRDVIGFLLRGGWNGVQNGAQPFQRWVFGRYRDFGAKGHTVRYLLVALLAILSLIVMNAALVTVSAARSPLMPRQEWLSDALFADLTTVFNVVLAGMLCLALPILIAKGLHQKGGSAAPRGAFSRLSWWGLGIALAAMVAAGAAIPILSWLHFHQPKAPSFLRNWQGGWLVERFDAGLELVLAVGVIVAAGFAAYKLMRALKPPPPRPRATKGSSRGGGGLIFVAAATAVLLVAAWGGSGFFLARWQVWSAPLGALSWILLVFASSQIRTLMIQYPGDVAAYVSPHILDRFNELRTDIRNCVYKQALAVYALKDGDSFAYDRIFVVGHSLGSVVVYDTLNRLIMEDELAKRAMKNDPAAGESFLNVLERSKLLLTFGSPLDKTAFLFSLQGKNTSETREALSAEVQPMIQHAGFRPFPWVNVWSKQDIISGSLDFYDPPAGGDAGKDPSEVLPAVVENVEDPEATTVLLAHVEYWGNAAVFGELHKRLIRRA